MIGTCHSVLFHTEGHGEMMPREANVQSVKTGAGVSGQEGV